MERDDEATTRDETMEAACVERYGGPEVVRIVRVPTPRPGPSELRIRTLATTVNSGDHRIRSLEVPRGFGPLLRLAMGFSRPRQPILGTELVGVVESIGAQVTDWRVGDVVIAYPGVGMRAHAELVVMPANGRVIPKPASLSIPEAAALCFGGLTALHYLRTAADVREGEKVLVLGASGTVGTAVLQIARAFLAETTAVCSGANAELVRGLGATRVVDYTRERWDDVAGAYDVVVDCVGHTRYAEVRTTLRPGGRFVRIVADLVGTIVAPLQGRLHGHRVIAGVSTERVEDMRLLASLADEGRYRPVIDRVMTFSEIREAHARVGEGRKRGSVVLTREGA